MDLKIVISCMYNNLVYKFVKKSVYSNIRNYEIAFDVNFVNCQLVRWRQRMKISIKTLTILIDNWMFDGCPGIGVSILYIMVSYGLTNIANDEIYYIFFGV